MLSRFKVVEIGNPFIQSNLYNLEAEKGADFGITEALWENSDFHKFTRTLSMTEMILPL